MAHLHSEQMTMLLASLAVLLGTARVFGELARKARLPVIVGELAAGIVLGPTVLGGLAPSVTQFLFPAEGPVAYIHTGFTSTAIVFFLLVAGMEVDLATMRRESVTAFAVAITGVVLPLSIMIGVVYLAPGWFGDYPASHTWVLAGVLGVAVSISALPVIARTLMDLDLYRSDLGMIVMGAAIVKDLIGWILFALILGAVDAQAPNGMSVTMTILMVLVFTAFMLTIGRWLFHGAVVWIQAHTSWPAGILSFAITFGLLGAALTQWMGIHAIFGSFMIGVALGESSHLREQTRMVMHQFVSFVFAPLFFAGIGLHVNFIAAFDLALLVILLLIAFLGKMVGSSLGARFAGMPRRECWAIGFATNSHGAMGIILGQLALQFQLIDERLFVAIVLMSITTSVVSGPCMQRILRMRRTRRFYEFLDVRTFVPSLASVDRWDVLDELARTAAIARNIPPEAISEAVKAREELQATGVGEHLAVPHARIDGFSTPLIALGLSAAGVDFDAPDGEPARVICLILTDKNDHDSQLAILSDIARTFRVERIREQVLAAKSFRELLSTLRTEEK